MSEFNEGGSQPETKQISVEQELSPEIVEMVMKKIDDLNRDGLAFTVLNHTGTAGAKNIKLSIPSEEIKESLSSCLKSGILGKNFYEEKTTRNRVATEDERKKMWREGVRKQKMKNKKEGTTVYFNIVGREYSLLSPQKGRTLPISDSHYIRNMPGSITMLFNIDRFTETIPPKRDDNDPYVFDHPVDNKKGPWWSEPHKLREYAVHDTGAQWDEKGRTTVESSTGFSLFPRIRPSDFTGIVFAMGKDGPKIPGHAEFGVWENERDDWKNEDRPEVLSAYAHNIAKIMLSAYRDRPELLLPIYDVNGNMWWPKQMSYEEVKKLVAEKGKDEKPRT